MLKSAEQHNSVRTDLAFQRCINPSCGATYDAHTIRTACDRCGDLLDVAYDWDRVGVPEKLSDFEAMWSQRTNPIRFSGVWRFHELLPFAPHDKIVTVGEGQTLLQKADEVAKYVGMNAGQLHLQYEGMNPSGSFKRQWHVRRRDTRRHDGKPNGPLARARATPARPWRSTAVRRKR